ncbi:MAG: hypothetical protein KGY66_00775 [Candidatus Thermoplasmatota archaeon]|nr:hypothetical protein [Candidatus Thermoplasmatota archaeon]
MSLSTKATRSVLNRNDDGPVRIEDYNLPFFKENGPSGKNKSFTICELLESKIPASFQIPCRDIE